jgi:predicted transcriptional regulator
MKKTDVPKFTTPKGESVAKTLQKVSRASTNELVTLTGRPIKSVLSTLRTLHTRSKIHIGGYEVNKRGQVNRIWFWGDGDDKREPVVNSKKEKFIPRLDEAAAWLRNPI